MFPIFIALVFQLVIATPIVHPGVRYEMETKNNSTERDSTSKDSATNDLGTECSCEYKGEDKNVIAHVAGKELFSYDRVENGSIVEFSCRVTSYRLKGKKEITCENCQPWQTSQFPTCINPRPGYIVILNNSHVKISSDGAWEVQIGKAFWLICYGLMVEEFPVWKFPDDHGIIEHNERKVHEGFRLLLSHLNIKNITAKNEGSYTCVAGTISPITVKIRVTEVKCEMPRALLNGSVQLDGELEVNSTALYTCGVGTTLVGASISKCLTTGEWSFPPPMCLMQCFDEPPLIENGIAVVTDRLYGSKISYRCNINYQKTKGGEVVCHYGTWTGNLPMCTKPGYCHSYPPPVKNLLGMSFNRDQGSVVIYVCQENYAKLSRGEVRCEYGTWIGQPPICHSILGPCHDEPPPVENAYMTVQHGYHGSNIYYRCRKNYHKIREGNVTCLYGRWTGHPPICIRLQCHDEPPPVENAYVAVSHRFHGSKIYYHCKENYVKRIRENVRCHHGEWIGRRPLCTKQEPL